MAKSLTLQEWRFRKQLVQALPTFAEIPKAPPCNAPSNKIPRDDKLWTLWDNQVRDIMRAVVALHLSAQDDPSCRVLPPPVQQLQDLFALASCLSKSIEAHRLKCVDTRLAPSSSPEDNVLIAKEEVLLLEKRAKITKQLSGYKGNSFAFRRPYGFKGKGKSKGFSGKGWSNKGWGGRGKGKPFGPSSSSGAPVP
jgi:hypothetical protein